MVSQFWYILDGHEKGHSKVFANGTNSMIYQLKELRLFKAVSVSVQFIRRNSPRNAKMGCLEDFMKSEESFFVTWRKAFDFLDLQVSEQQLYTLFADLNPLSKSASEVTLSHGTSIGKGRKKASLGYAHDVLRLEPDYNVSTVLFETLADLSRQTNCWNWSTNSRGTKDEWQL